MSKKSFKTLTFAPKQVLFREGEMADYAYVIRSGSVRVSKKGPSGKSIPIALVEKGGIVGEMAIVSDAPRSATVTAHEAVEVLAISKDSFENKLQSIDPFLYSLIKTVIARLRQTSSHTVNLYEKVKQAQGKQFASEGQNEQTPAQKGFSAVNFILADPNPQTRNSLRGGLFGLGFKEICDVSTLFQVREQLKKDHYDLMIIDAAFGAQEVAQFIHQIRHGIDCKNPFITLVVLTQNKSKSNYDALINAGSDQVLLKPLSVEKISDTINMLCTTQRRFIVTRDYIGPDRASYRNDAGESAPSFEAPNTLAAKVLHGAGAKDLELVVHNNVTLFNKLKMERHLVQLGWLVDRLTPHPPTGSDYDPDYLLDCADSSLEDLCIRVEHSDMEQTCEICKGMRKLVGSLRQDTSLRGQKMGDMSNFYKELCENLPLGQNGDIQSQALIRA